MPIYEYVCAKCAHKFEELREMKDTSGAKCPKCGAKADRTVVSRTGVIGSRKRDNACCGREEGCDRPSCSGGGGCCR